MKLPSAIDVHALLVSQKKIIPIEDVEDVLTAAEDVMFAYEERDKWFRNNQDIADILAVSN